MNEVVNELAYNPPGSEEGYLFWFAWSAHLGNSILNMQDAHGPVRRGRSIVSRLRHAGPGRRDRAGASTAPTGPLGILAKLERHADA